VTAKEKDSIKLAMGDYRGMSFNRNPPDEDY
jgi:hypothetical protein